MSNIRIFFTNAMRDKLLKIIISLAIIIILDYNFGEHYNKLVDKLLNFYKPILNQINPCSQTINYSLGDFDNRFNLTKEEFLQDLETAEKIWETPMGRNLFNYTIDGGLKINLIYDYRQEATDKLRKLGITIDNTRESYEDLRKKYNTLKTEYNEEKNKLDILIKKYDADSNTYEKEVASLNKKNNISREQRQKIEADRMALNKQADQINKTQDDLKELTDEINAIANVINRLIGELNINAENYNDIGTTRGKEFQEGEYLRDANGERITIYQFDDKNKLVRVLAHELGHALGLEHNNNPDSIMYAFNEGKNEKLSPDDINDMYSFCGRRGI